jgi:hypothetical protein
VKSDTPTAYGFFDNVLVLQNANDVTKVKILPIIAQFRNPLFKRSLYEIIQPRAKRIVDFDFLQQGYALTQEIIDSWTDVEYIDKLDKLYQNIHLEQTTLNRFSKIKMGGLFLSGKISPLLINSLLEADDLMTVEESDDLALQKSLINRAFNHLSPLEPARIKLTSKVAMCKTFKDFLLLWTRYKVSQQVIVDDLTADGYIIQPKTYLLSQGSTNPDKGKPDKLPKQQNINNNADRTASTLVPVKLDPAILACSGCGRQEYDGRQKAVHDVNNCFLKNHPDRNNDPLIKWKDSSSGKAFAALNPPWKVLPYSILKDGSKRDLPSKR